LHRNIQVCDRLHFFHSVHNTDRMVLRAVLRLSHNGTMVFSQACPALYAAGRACRIATL
jgi:hypothetical protein